MKHYFRLSWSYNYAGQLLPLGNMTLNRVADLRRVGGLRYNFDTEQPTLLDIESVDSCGAEPAERKAAEESLHPQFGLRWKIFEDSVLQFCLFTSSISLLKPPTYNSAEAITQRSPLVGSFGDHNLPNHLFVKRL